MNNIFSIKNLFYSFEQFKIGKTKNKKIIEFELNLEKNIFQLYKELKEETYVPAKPNIFWIKDPKKRKIEAAPVRDRVVHHALCDFLKNNFEKTFIFDNYANRKNKGVLPAILKLNTFFRQESKNYTKKIYFLKCDVKKYFDNIDQALLFKMLTEKIEKINLNKNEKRKILKILQKIIFLKDKKNGIPIGNLTSQFFANFYLNDFDHYVEEQLKVKKYIRYMDDFICVSKNRNFLESLIPLFEEYLTKKLKLNLHPKKIKIYSSKSGIDFLGYYLKPYYFIIRFKTRKRMIKKMRGLKNKNFINKFNGYHGYCKYAHEYNFLKPYFKKVKNIKQSF